MFSNKRQLEAQQALEKKEQEALEEALRKAAEDEGDLSTAKEKRRVWLVKIPNFLADSWAQCSQSDLELGRVKMIPDGEGRPPKMRLILKNPPSQERQVLESFAKFPKEYDLQLLSAEGSDALQILSTTREEGGGVSHAIEGTVDQRLDVKPQNTPEYRALCRERQLKSTTHLRQVKTIDAIEHKRTAFVKPISAAMAKKMRQEKAYAAKRERVSKDEAINRILSAFESQPAMNIKDLSEKTDQPMNYLKEIMKDVCVNIRTGPNRGLYELKPELKGTSSSSGGAGAGPSGAGPS
eukprot:tig00000219_g19483.t1